MNKGELLGKGMTAEVYKWGEDKVLKLFLEGFKEEYINLEASNGKKLHEAGVPSPEVFDIVEIDGRKGIIFERILGNTMTDAFIKEPWKFINFIKQMSRFHSEIHKFSASDIPTQKERLEKTIRRSSEILGDRLDKILNYVDSLPGGNTICHGDFYLSNIMISGKKLVAIDWMSGYRGDPASDIARTYMMINTHATIPGTPHFMTSMADFPKSMTYKIYLNEYLKNSNIDTKRIDAWMLPVAASRLKDWVPGEKKWLMGIIDKRLKQLEK